MQFNREYWVSFTHGEVGTRAGVVEYESHVFGFASIVIGIVDWCRDAEPSIGLIFDKRRPRVCVTCGIVDDILVRAGYYDWGHSVTIRRLLYAKEMTFNGKNGSTSIF